MDMFVPWSQSANITTQYTNKYWLRKARNSADLGYLMLLLLLLLLLKPPDIAILHFLKFFKF